ncbi:MAG: hypothetical protein AAFP19_19235, partial [Bacteroidota bacterium]
MKKLFMLVAFFGVFTLAANAQTCTKSKSMSGKATCSKTAAAKVAAMDDSIEARTCAKSGKV